MKAILLIIIYICLFPVTILGQEHSLSKEMETFLNVCLKLREGIEKRNVNTLNECISAFNELELAEFDRFKSVDNSGEVPIEGHLLFRPDYVDSLLIYDMNLAAIRIDAPTLLRAAPFDCKLTHRALAPHSKGVYSTKGSGERELLVVAENGGRINLFVSDETNHIQIEDTAPNGKEAAWVSWKMNRFGTYTITIKNTSDKAISFVIVAN